jgi:hypothetical protein
MDRLNLQYVEYHTPANWFIETVHAYRQQAQKSVAGKNLAIATFFDCRDHNTPYYEVGCSDPYGWHSERYVINTVAAWALRWSTTAVINALYTERRPCGKGPGMKECEGWLIRLFKDPTTENFPKIKISEGLNTPVWYSYDYPAGGQEETEDVMTHVYDLQLSDEDIAETRPLYLETAKEDRKQTTLDLIRNDRLLRQPGRVRNPGKAWFNRDRR